MRVMSYLESKAASPAPPTPKAANQLEALKSMSKVVADTGEIEAMKLYKPVDCTTNPRCELSRLRSGRCGDHLSPSPHAQLLASPSQVPPKARLIAPLEDRNL